MIKEYAHVRFIQTGKTGIVVDAREVAPGKWEYTVEDDYGNYSEGWELIDCKEDEIEEIE